MNFAQQSPRLVIVIPTKNRRELLGHALGSTLSQSYDAYRVVIVDDGSTDGTREYLDSLTDERLQVIRFEKSRGVNAARNAALRTLQEGEWAVPLDDDDVFLPNAFATIAHAIKTVPPAIQVIGFNTIFKTPAETFSGGYQFKKGEAWHDPTYAEIMGGGGGRGDGRSVLKWTVFRRHLFSEDINGYEHEFWMLLARDEVKRRYLPEKIVFMDMHPGEHLSAVAARRDPASFARACQRIFRDHAKFFATHPNAAKERALEAIKIAIRAYDVPRAALFSFYYLRALLLILKGVQDKP